MRYGKGVSSQPNKTQPTAVSFSSFVDTLDNDQRKADALALSKLMEDISGHKPVMWGPSIVGFDTCHYKYESGREGDMGILGFSPRKANMVVYLVDGVSRYKQQLSKLGPHTTGKVCIYIKRLSDIDMGVLEQILHDSYTYAKTHDQDMGRAE